MKVQWQFWMWVGISVAVVGCARAQTRVVDMPRVDQELQGNQGYLAGKPSAEAQARKTTRQVIVTDVELATGQEIKDGIRRHWPGKKQAQAPQKVSQVTAPARPAIPMAPAQPAEVEDEYEQAPSPAMEAAPVTVASTTYVVQKNDTLEKIAKKVYGNSSQWSKIYKANREIIKNPNRLYVGQKLAIPASPAGEAEDRRASYDETIK